MKTKTLILISTIALSSFACGQQVLKTPKSKPVHRVLSAGKAYSVKIISEKGVVSTLHVPQNILLYIRYDSSLNPRLERRRGTSFFPRTFRGDMVIRTKRVDEVERPIDEKKPFKVFAESPLEMELKNATVVFERLEAPSNELGMR